MAMIKINLRADAEAEDIPGMREMPDEGYANWINGELFFVDHHDILRAAHGEYPFATTASQVRMLITYLKTVEKRMRQGEG